MESLRLERSSEITTGPPQCVSYTAGWGEDLPLDGRLSRGAELDVCPYLLP